MNISIVVPVYNTEKYLPRCLDGLCAQGDSVKEIVIINDGSTDGGLEICNEYAKKDARIKIIDKENGGTEQAIIDGVNAASCEYIGFVDSDDSIEYDMFDELAKSAEEFDADIVVCNYDDEDETGRRFGKRDLGMGDSGLHVKKDGRFDFQVLPSLANGRFASGSRWNKLFKKSLLVNNIAFRKNGIRMGEDLALVLPVMMSAERIAYVDKCLYHYFQRSDSIVHSYKRKNLDDWKKYMEMFASAVEHYDYRGIDIQECAVSLLVQHCIKWIRHSDLSFGQRKKEYAYIGKDRDVRKALKSVKIGNAPYKKRILLRLLKYRMYGILAAI